MKFSAQNSFLLLILFLGAALLHFASLSILPFPFNHANVFLVLIIWLLFFSTRPVVVWLALPAGFLLELFSPRPFGIIALSLTATSVIISWALLNLLTHRSIYMVLLVGFLGSIFYRVFIYLFSSALSLISQEPGLVLVWSWSDFAGEIFSTTIILFCLYFISSFFIRRLKPQYLGVKDWKYGR